MCMPTKRKHLLIHVSTVTGAALSLPDAHPVWAIATDFLSASPHRQIALLGRLDPVIAQDIADELEYHDQINDGEGDEPALINLLAIFCL